MKVLIVYDEINADNLFVPTLKKSISDFGIDIISSVDIFWNSQDAKFDIIHFHWPEEVVGWNTSNIDVIKKLKERLDYWKKKGTKYVYTRHNLKPHYLGIIQMKAYELIESYADLTVHMGNFSLKNLSPFLFHAKHKIIPHHIYNEAYDIGIDINEAKQKLHIPSHKKVITAFGKFRNKNEVFMILKAFCLLRLTSNKYILLAPRLLPKKKSKFLRNVLHKIFRCLGIIADENYKIISNEEVPYYMASSDIIVVQRIEILNSGNVPQAFLFKKVVVGPDVGNVGVLLKETQNPTFNPQKTRSLVSALKKGLKLSSASKGLNNHNYAMKYFSSQKIAQKYIEAYKSIL